MTSRVLTLGGGGFSMEPDNPLLDDFCLSLVPHDRTPRVCFVGTASGDAATYEQSFHDAFDARAETTVLRLFAREVRDLGAFVRGQDVVYVGGGSTLNLLTLWREHGLDTALREAWAEGVVLAGVSAGMNCWFEGSITDSWSTDLDPLPDGLGFLPGSACPHYDGEERRRPAYEAAVASGALGPGWAADDGCALLFTDGTLDEVVSSRPTARAYRVEPGADGTATSIPLDARYLG